MSESSMDGDSLTEALLELDEFPEPEVTVDTDNLMNKDGSVLEVRQATTGRFYIVYPNGGELPRQLKGEFTNEELAKQAILEYIANN